MAKHPVFPMWIQDYLADTSHLDATEHGVYHLLLYRYWLTQCRPLPDDMAFLKRVTHCRSTAKLRSILDQFWKLSTGEGWHHRRAQREFRVTRERSYVQREKAKKRWEINNHAYAAADAAAMPPYPKEEEEKKTLSSRGQKKRRNSTETTAHGTRLAEDWKPRPEDHEWAKMEFPSLAVGKEFDKFRDYWLSMPGQRGRKADWSRTWRNWIRKAAESQPRPRNNTYAGKNENLEAMAAQLGLPAKPGESTEAWHMRIRAAATRAH